MEYEIRFYYPLEKYNEKLEKLKKMKELNYGDRKYEITSQFDHPCEDMSFYSKKVDGRFRIRRTESDNDSKCMISWKKRLPNTIMGDINKEEEVELSINPKEYNNLIFLVNNVLHMKEIETYERYRTVFFNKEVEIVLDQYPFGLALEIEAKSDNIDPKKIIGKYVKLMDLNYDDAYRLSWDDKYEELCKEQNVKIYNQVLFDKDMPEIK